MITHDAVECFERFLKDECAKIGASCGIEVRPFGPRTGLVEFSEQMTQRQANALERSLTKHPKVDVGEDGLIWLDEYEDVCGLERTVGAERCLLFDIAAPEMFVYTEEEKAQYRAAFIITIDDKWRNGPTNVFMPLRFQYFDAIKNGDKTVECREYTKNWVKRLLGPKVETITFQRGYASNAEKIVVEVESIDLEDEDGKTRYAADAIPDMSMPSLILIHLGRRIS